MSRRAVLAAAGTTAAVAAVGGGLSGCVPGPSIPPAAQTQPQVDPLTPVLRLQQELVKLYREILAAFPELAVALTEFQTQTNAHTEALLAAAPVAAAQIAATGSGPTSAPASSSSPAPAPAADAATGLANLNRAIDASAGALRTAALRADGELAALLGSCAASTTCHGRLLG